MIIVVGDTPSSVEINAGGRLGDPSEIAAAQYVSSNRQHQSMGRLPIYVYGYLCLQRKFEAAELVHKMHHKQTLCDWLMGTPMILNFRQAPPHEKVNVFQLSPSRLRVWYYQATNLPH